MNALVRLPYELSWRAANAIAPLVPALNNKIVRTLRSRVNLLAKIDAWAGAHRDTARPLIWMHAASVGESLQALPVLNLLRARNPEAQTVFTFYSPSAETAVKQFPADFVSFLPFDTAESMRHVIRSLSPAALVFSKLDVWPILVQEALHAGVKTGIISATLHAESGRRSMLASLLLRDTYAALDAIGAISEEDRRNIIELGARAARVAVTGDTRYDQVWARSNQPGPTELLDHLRTGRPTVVAGSTWKSDEAHLFPAFQEIRKKHKRIRLIIAPHEPDSASVTHIQGWAERNDFTSSRIDNPQAASSDIVIVDRVGVLGDLYTLADIAYVGGGFHRPGIHSILEPASFGKPVLFGATHALTRDADIVVAAGAAKAIKSTSELESTISAWLSDSPARAAAGAAALSVVKKGLGAAEASYKLVENLLSGASALL